MPNGTPGDHPLTDILVYRRPVFSEEVDDLVRELDTLHVWGGDLISFLMLSFHQEYERLRDSGEQRRAGTLLHNFARILRAEKERLSEGRR